MDIGPRFQGPPDVKTHKTVQDLFKLPVHALHQLQPKAVDPRGPFNIEDRGDRARKDGSGGEIGREALAAQQAALSEAEESL